MRFNDLMQTVLAADGQGSGAVTLWRQCVDLVAQTDRVDRNILPDQDRETLLARMEQLRSAVSETQRIASVVELGGRLSSPTLVRFFALDRPAICAAAMARARLPDDVWPRLLSALGPTARGVLRGRRDIGPQTRRALEAFGKTDLVLGGSGEDAMLLTPDMAVEAVAVEPSLKGIYRDAPERKQDAEDKSQIRALVDRIEQFTSSHKAKPADTPPDPLEPVRAFAFETDATGTVVWIDKGPRTALIGLCIGLPALAGGSGPDANVSGAFTKRSGFENGRFTIAGGELAGEWRLSAIPYFDAQSGRFQGYRGQARRPHLHEVPALAGLEDSSPLAGLSGDAVRQLVHELRTPLNAILGFAEIIEQQLFGPAPAEYREMAGQIVADSRHLLTAFDDLDFAARVARDEKGGAPESVDVALLIARIAAHFASCEEKRRIDVTVARDLPAVRVDPVQGERMIQHLLRMLLSVSPPGEVMTGACWFQPAGDGGRIVLAMDRPHSLKGMSEAELLDPGFAADDQSWPDAPLLGLGFSLRLIRSLAATGGGGLEVEAERFRLHLPAAAEAVRETGPS
ncbi:MAG: HAMP domain-containing sensor histidine kinase [Sphingobium sp.]|uniref:sensor histidine kinase n=1 Tax=Sphingobium sp. TaxID=1912891 RepID=UPI0029ACEFBB|nr:HAMP domain-containing sensor histidine kinase [Sphingobium sp.]MDX3909752.1 HAMP domain-containing sensor histidine kinase [Sphingobium sp.]